MSRILLAQGSEVGICAVIIDHCLAEANIPQALMVPADDRPLQFVLIPLFVCALACGSDTLLPARCEGGS